MLYNATNLTYLNINKYNDTFDFNTINAIFNSGKLIVGSLNSLQNCINIKQIYPNVCTGLIGNIETTFVNMSRLSYVSVNYNWFQIDYGWLTGNESTNISGNISIFADKYDMENLQVMRYTLVNGELKSLKNLKKLYYVGLLHTNCIGSKTDLWNNGSNITSFRI